MAGIVIIDDEEMVRYGVNYILAQNTQYRVLGEARDGNEGLCIIRKLRPDIAIVDIRMPNMSGLELARIVQNEKLQCKIVILSVYSEFKYAKEALRCGVYDYLTKPIDAIELVSSLQRIKTNSNSSNSYRDIIEIDLAQEIASSFLKDCEALHPLIFRTIVYISEFFGHDLSLAQIAERFRVSPSYLSRLFVQSVGINLVRFINDFRIRLAQELLSHSQYSIAEIAKITGYKTPQYFCRVFKEFTLCSPQVYLYENRK
jgi:two-component system response regulator YesN